MDRSQFEVDRRRRTVYDLAGCYRRAGAADRHQATPAASAYETAFAATVPLPLIVANRSLLQHSSLRISWGRTLGRPLQLRLTTPRCGAHDAAVVYSYAGASANGVTSDPQPPGPEQRRRQALRLRCSSPARRHTGCAGLCALGHTVDNAGGQHGRTRGLRFELHSTVIPFTPAAGWPASPGQRSAGWLQTKRGLNSS